MIRASAAARWTWLLAVLLAGCATQPPPVPPGTADLTGAWDGEWDGGSIGTGHIGMTLQQSGDRVLGDLSIGGVQAISATDGRVEGRVIGDRFRFTQPAGVIEGELEVHGDQMIGQATGRLKMALRLTRQR